MDTIKNVKLQPAATPAASTTPYDSITVNGKPAQIVNGQLQIPRGGKVEIKTHYDAGVLNQGPVEISLKGSGSATQAQLKKLWHVKSETYASPDGKPVPPHQCGGMRYETFSFTAPKSNDGLAVTLTQGKNEQTLNFAAQQPTAPALAPAKQQETAAFGGWGHGGPGGGWGHPGPGPGWGHPGPGWGHPGPGWGHPMPPPGWGWHRPPGRPWFNPWNPIWGHPPIGWAPGCEWNPMWGPCPEGYYVP